LDLETTVARHDTQIGKIVAVLETVVERQNRLDDALVDLADGLNRLTEAQIRTEKELAALTERLAESQARTEEEHRRLAARLTESNIRTDERIQSLVSAIGEWLRRPA